MPDFEKQPLRSKFEAAILDAGQKMIHKSHGKTKAEVIGAMRGTVVEIGPGTGANLRYYAPGVHVIGIEPNPVMRKRLRDAANEHGVDLEIRSLRGEAIDVEDGSADAVVATLVLCGVDHPAKVVHEVWRVLKSGGTYFFLEHIVSPEGTFAHRAQKVLLRPHRWLFNGCEVNRDTAPVIEAAGFTDVSIEPFDAGPRSGHVRHFIIGTAIK